MSLTNEANALSEHRSYDPFGKPRKGDYRQSSPATLTGVVGATPFTSRGYTDHEHLDGAQLIHMNGRVYDYNIGRFYSVDPVIQAPGNSQSLNPYSYIMNNPLAGTDPTGYTSECVEQCPEPTKRSEPKKRSGRSFVQDWHQVYDRQNNGAVQNAKSTEPKTGAQEIGSQKSIAKQQNGGGQGSRQIASTSPVTKGVAGLSQQDLSDAAKSIGTDEAAILAVGEVESGNEGFLPSGDPKILFEAHKFSQLTGGKYDKTNPDISVGNWAAGAKLYKGGQAEYMRLAEAMNLDMDAAIMATSWGRFQILGENYKAAGYSSPKTFMSAMLTSEVYHLRAFMNFVNRSTIRSQSLQNHNWAK